MADTETQRAAVADTPDQKAAERANKKLSDEYQIVEKEAIRHRDSHPSGLAQMVKENSLFNSFKNISLAEYALGIQLVELAYPSKAYPPSKVEQENGKACVNAINASSGPFVDVNSATLRLPADCMPLVASLDIPLNPPKDISNETLNAFAKVDKDINNVIDRATALVGEARASGNNTPDAAGKIKLAEALASAVKEERDFSLSLLSFGSSYSEKDFKIAETCSAEILKPGNLSFIDVDSAKFQPPSACLPLVLSKELGK